MPLIEEEIDGLSGLLFPFYDADTHMLYLAGKVVGGGGGPAAACGKALPSLHPRNCPTPLRIASLTSLVFPDPTQVPGPHLSHSHLPSSLTPILTQVSATKNSFKGGLEWVLHWSKDQSLQCSQ